MANFDDILGTSSGSAEIDRIMEFTQAACMMLDPARESKSLTDRKGKSGPDDTSASCPVPKGGHPQ